MHVWLHGAASKGHEATSVTAHSLTGQGCHKAQNVTETQL